MPHSLKSRIKSLCYKGEISEKERDKIIKALEQQPCEDCISRAYIESIVEELENICINGDEHILSLLSNIKNAPSVTPKARWIPVSERLPKIHQDVLLSLRSLDVLDGFRAGTEPYFYCQGDYIEPQNVVAWMPLPQPYGESEDKE